MKPTLIIKSNGTTEPLNVARWYDDIAWASKGHPDVSAELIVQEALKNIFNGISSVSVENALILATTALIERDPSYSYVASQFLLKKLFKEMTQQKITIDTY